MRAASNKATSLKVSDNDLKNPTPLKKKKKPLNFPTETIYSELAGA